MSVLTNAGFWTGIAGVITAVTVLVRLVQHKNNPDAHSGNTPPQP